MASGDTQGTTSDYLNAFGDFLGFNPPEIDKSAGRISGSADTQARYRNMQEDASRRSAPKSSAAQVGNANTMQAAQLDTGPQAEMRARQTAFLDQLNAQLRGEGPSVAEQQMKRGLDANLAQAASLASVQRGVSGGLAQRQLGQQRAAASQQAAADASMLRAQEQLNAGGLMSQTLAGVRGQDLSLADAQAQLEQGARGANMAALNQYGLAQAGFNQQTGLANQQAQLAALAQNDAFRQFLMGQSDTINSQEMQARLALEQMRIQGETGAADNRANFLGGLLQTLGQLGMTAAGGGGK